MDQPAWSAPRLHHFYVTIAKFIFHHPEHGIVSVRDPIRIEAAARYGLSPLLLYGVTVAGLPIRWMTFTPLAHPRPLREILLEAWCHAAGLRGQPDILLVNRHLAAACPDLVEGMAEIGVRVEIAGAKEKSLPASLRSAQDAAQWLRRRVKGNEPLPVETVRDLCRYAQQDHDFRFRDGHRYVYNHRQEARVQQWLALPALVPQPAETGRLDWAPGPWLSSWEASLPPDQPRFFSPDGPEGHIWLLTGKKPPEGCVQDDGFWIDYDDDNTAEIASDLVACWPNPPLEIAQRIGTTLRELQRFLSRKATLDDRARLALETLLGLEYDMRTGGTVGTGPYVLLARKFWALREVCDSLSHGGDARPCELVPRRKDADPSWRYVLINPYGEPPSIVMAPRGAKITEQLPDLLLNYGGTVSVTPEFYQDVVSTCARACREPAANLQEMRAFAQRHIARWIDGIWEPG